MMRFLLFFLAVFCLVQSAPFGKDRTPRIKRQTYKYDDALMLYAHPHPGTKVTQGYLARYAPQDWPKWYSRTMMKWDGMSMMSPYDRNDARYPAWASDYVKRTNL